MSQAEGDGDDEPDELKGKNERRAVRDRSAHHGLLTSGQRLEDVFVPIDIFYVELVESTVVGGFFRAPRNLCDF